MSKLAQLARAVVTLRDSKESRITRAHGIASKANPASAAQPSYTEMPGRQATAFLAYYRRAGAVLLLLLSLLVLSADSLMSADFAGAAQDITEQLRDMPLLALLFVPAFVFYCRERLARAPRNVHPLLEIAGRWLAVLGFALAVTLAFSLATSTWVSAAPGSSPLGNYDVVNGELQRNLGHRVIRSAAALAGAAVFVALYWRARNSWKAVVVRMASVAIALSAGTAAFALAVLPISGEEYGAALAVTLMFLLIIGLFSLGPLIRARRSAGVHTPTEPHAQPVVDGAKCVGSAKTQAQLVVAVVLLALYIVSTHDQLTSALFGARKAVAIEATRRAISECLVAAPPDLERLAAANVWSDAEGPWAARPGDDAVGPDAGDWPEAERVPAFRDRRLTKGDSPQVLKITKLSNGRSIGVIVTWVSTRTGSDASFQVRTVWDIRVGLTVAQGDQGREWTHVVARASPLRRWRHGRGSVLRRENSPEYDLARWLHVHQDYDSGAALAGISLGEGIDARQGTDLMYGTRGVEILVDALGRVERAVSARSVAVPMVGLSLPPVPALLVLGFLLLYLLASICNSLHCAVGDPSAGKGEPWLVLDSHKLLEHCLSLAWIGILVGAPWIVAAGWLHMVVRQCLVNGDLSSGRMTGILVLSVVFTGAASRLGFGIVSALGVLREGRARKVLE